MKMDDKVILEKAIIAIIREKPIKNQAELIEVLKDRYIRIGKEPPFACNQSQISKLLKKLNITKSVDGRYIQATKEEIVLYNYLYDHTNLFNYRDYETSEALYESNISVISSNIVIIKLNDNTAQEACELINKATNFKVIAHASYNAITLISTYCFMCDFWSKIDEVTSFSKYKEYYCDIIDKLQK